MGAIGSLVGQIDDAVNGRAGSRGATWLTFPSTRAVKVERFIFPLCIGYCDPYGMGWCPPALELGSLTDKL